ncbi:hypothetical protein PACTADRAFT_87405 [Pachysolen tannophilus NRRL Y-2460]|uniref:Cytochrome c oxidase subunit 2 n=1 Tax=Pachysolen tannophilus NRRL Y-2460 TaxID=669874 RepID=A0A1E4TMZ3_PACTA|nr:hypothetical protein PACTADRAFT_87405 [Pachysolen tannophilus NRRL Y-2460]
MYFYQFTSGHHVATPNMEGIIELHNNVMFYLILILIFVSYVLYSIIKNDSNKIIEFESYIIPEDLLEDGQLRMLDVDASIVVPVDTHIRFIVSSADVLHDFCVPSLGIKIDAAPGRLNQTSALIQREGVYYGQCSELCGVFHSAMPIKVEAVSLYEFIN